MNLFFFGDSVVQGLWDEKGGWPTRIMQDVYSDHLEYSEPHLDYNMVYLRGVSGDTSRKLDARIEQELKFATEHTSSQIVVVFSVGLNDCVVSGGENKVSIQEYRQNLQSIIDKLRRHADKVIAVGLSPIDEEKLLSEGSVDQYSNEEVRRYDKTLNEICSKNQVKFIPTLEKLLEDKDWNQKLFDGLHPNSEGHKRIYEITKDPIISEINFQRSS